MNNDLSGVLKEADPQEVIEQLKLALKEKSAFIDDLKAERDAYRQVLIKIKYSKTPYPKHIRLWASEAVGLYSSPSKDNDNG